MNLKIVASVSIAFIITFSSLFLIINLSTSSERIDYRMEFYSKEIEPDINKVYLIGSSHIGHLNMTHIIEQVSKNHPSYTVYNLAENGDTPKIRYESLSEIIKDKPKIVFYGISYRDFNEHSVQKYSKTEMFDIKQYFYENIPDELKSINPQLLTRKAFRTLFDQAEIIKKPVYDIQPPNTPFFALSELQTKIASNDELERQILIVLPSPSEIQINAIENEEMIYFKKIINELQENDIQVVIFTTPLNKIYLDEISEDLDTSFQKMLNEIANEYKIKTYNFTKSYSDDVIWNNLDHVAYNEKSIIFSQDVSEMILKEIED